MDKKAVILGFGERRAAAMLKFGKIFLLIGVDSFVGNGIAYRHGRAATGKAGLFPGSDFSTQSIENSAVVQDP